MRPRVAALAAVGLLAVLVLAPAPRAEDAPAAPAAPRLSVAIAAPEHLGARNLELAGFPVVVRNESDAPLGVWREWCSWGWFQLTFVVTDASGESFVVRKKERGWRKNYPDAWRLAPGEPLVLTPRLSDGDVWENADRLAKLRDSAVTVQAVFTAEAGEDSRGQAVWSGRVESAARSYRVR
jgi:hypothetical protein